MTAPTAIESGPLLVPSLTDMIGSADSQRVARALRRLGALFVISADLYRPDHIALFDVVLSRLAAAADTHERIVLAERLVALDRVPPRLVHVLARDGDIRVAGPLLRASHAVTEDDLAEIALSYGQPHLMALSVRAVLTPPVTDLIVRRGDRNVARSLAANVTARFSTDGFLGLMERSFDDGMLAVALGQRRDLPPVMLKDLIGKLGEPVRRQMLAVATPVQRALLDRISAEVLGAGARDRDVAVENTHAAAPVQRSLLQLHHAGRLDEKRLRDAANAHRYDEAIAALAIMTGVRLSVIDHLLRGKRIDPVLILGKAQGFEWRTVAALLNLVQDADDSSGSADRDEARKNYERLRVATAKHVMSFWTVRS